MKFSNVSFLFLALAFLGMAVLVRGQESKIDQVIDAHSFSMPDTMFFGVGHNGAPILVIHSDGRMATASNALPDDNARGLLVALQKNMRTSYADLEKALGLAEILADKSATEKKKEEARKALAELKGYWVPKFRYPNIGGPPPISPAAGSPQ